MNRDRIRQTLVIVFAILDIVSSFALGSSIDQGFDPTPVSFLPFGPTFAIWGVIFFTQLVYSIYQALPGQTERLLHRRIGWWVALNAALTALWNYTAGLSGTEGTPEFQPIYVVATVFILAGMLFSLTMVYIAFRELNPQITTRDRWLAQIPLTIFFAWLNVAAIANTTAALDAVAIFDYPYSSLWGVALILVGLVVTSLMVFYSRPNAGTIAYTAVIVWAFVGIFFNNNDRALDVAITALVASAILIGVTIFHFYRNQSAPAVQRTATNAS
ncbi:hypothetical protein HC928_18425 [bacterium]|nr:hypothetical protein [bacterium]